MKINLMKINFPYKIKQMAGIEKDIITSEEIPSNIKTIIYYNSDRLLVKKLIGKGGYGKVYLYESIKSDKQYAIKYFIGENGLFDYIQESSIYDNIQSASLQNYFVDTEFNILYRLVIMEKMDGDLFDLVKNKMTNEDKPRILKIIFEYIYTLYINKLYYTDIKLTNILYNIKDGKLIVKLCDLGSITNNKNETLSSYYYKQQFELTEQQLIYSLSMLVLQIMTHDIKHALNEYDSRDTAKVLMGIIKPYIDEVYDESKTEEDRDKIYKDFHSAFIKFFNDKISGTKNEN